MPRLLKSYSYSSKSQRSAILRRRVMKVDLKAAGHLATDAHRVSGLVRTIFGLIPNYGADDGFGRCVESPGAPREPARERSLMRGVSATASAQAIAGEDRGGRRELAPGSPAHQCRSVEGCEEIVHHRVTMAFGHGPQHVSQADGAGGAVCIAENEVGFFCVE